MNWKNITDVNDIHLIVERSNDVPCMILKHSTTCPISSIAKKRLEMNWQAAEEEMEVYYLDLLRHRAISNFIAEIFSVRHESPQVLVIKNGVCTHHASHLSISAEALA